MARRLAALAPGTFSATPCSARAPGIVDGVQGTTTQTLGVDKTATADDIKKAYRRLARKYHPDVSKEPNAAERMSAINEANTVLSDPEKRAAYDALGRRPSTIEPAAVTRPRNPLTPIAQAIQAFGKTPLGKAVQLAPLLALTASGRLPPGVSFDAQVEQKVRDMAEQLLQTTKQEEVATGQKQTPKAAPAEPINGTQTWSTVNQTRADRPVTLQQPADPREPTLIDHLNLNPREPGRAYNDVLSIASKPFYGASGVLFVPNVVTEQGIGIKGNGANPKDWGAGFFRGFNFTVQPLEVFATRMFPLDNARQSVQSSALRVQVSHAGGDYFSTGVHQSPSAGGGLAIDNLFNSKRTIVTNVGEAFGNFPYAWTRPDTNTVGGRVIGERGEIIFNSVEGLRRDNATSGQSIYQGGAPYSWAQDNVKFSLGTNPWSGYAYIGAQQELGVKVAGVGRENDAPGALPTSNWHLVGGKIVADSGANRAAWERSFDDSGLTLRSESLVPAIGEKAAAVFARVDDKLLSAGGARLAVRTIDGKDHVRASDVHARLAATGRSVAGYDELAAVQPRQFIDLNRDVSRMIDGEPFVARDTWVRTGTMVAEGVPGLAVPKAYARPSPMAVYGTPQTAFARTELPAQKPGLPSFGLRGVQGVPTGRTPPAPITPGQLANDAVQRASWKIDSTSRAAQVVAIGAALRDVDAAQKHYEQVMREGKNWFQQTIDAGRDVVWGAPDAQIANFEQQRSELTALLGQVGSGLIRGLDTPSVAPNTPRVQAELDRIEQRYKSEYRRVFDEQLRNAQIAQALWFASRGVVLSAAAAAALGAVTVGVKRGRPGPMLMGGVVGLTVASVFDAGSLLIGKTGPAGNSHFAPQIELQSPGAYVMRRMAGDAPGHWGLAAQKGLQDLAQAAAITFGIRLRASLDKKLIEATEKHLGTTGAISAVINKGPKELLDGTSGPQFWIKGLSADALRFGGTAGMSLLQGLTGDFINAGWRAAPAALFDPTRLYGGGDGKLAVAGRQISAQVADGLQRNLFRAGASGVTNVLNFRRGGEWFDGAANVFTTLLTGAAADQADGGIGRVSAATIAPDALAQTVENISSRHVPKALDPERFVEPQSAAFYARKFGVPEHTIRFLITNRHGQSGANLLHVTAGNTVVAEAQALGPSGRFDPSLHWLGRAAAQLRDHGVYGAAAKGPRHAEVQTGRCRRAAACCRRSREHRFAAPGQHRHRRHRAPGQQGGDDAGDSRHAGPARARRERRRRAAAARRRDPAGRGTDLAAPAQRQQPRLRRQARDLGELQRAADAAGPKPGLARAEDDHRIARPPGRSADRRQRLAGAARQVDRAAAVRRCEGHVPRTLRRPGRYERANPLGGRARCEGAWPGLPRLQRQGRRRIRQGR